MGFEVKIRLLFSSLVSLVTYALLKTAHQAASISAKQPALFMAVWRRVKVWKNTNFSLNLPFIHCSLHEELNNVSV